MPTSSRQWIYAEPIVDDRLDVNNFELRDISLPDIEVGQALVRVKLINIHCNSRMRLASGATPIGETERSNYACAEVLKSRDPAFQEGDIVACQAGWQEHQVISSADPAIGYPPASPLTRTLNRTTRNGPTLSAR